MTARFAILCPGQGGQHPGMFDLVRGDPNGAQVLADFGLDARLSHPLDTILSDDNLLFTNRYAQPLIVAAGLAAWEVMRHELPLPTLVAGYSVGELTAYGVSEALSPGAMIDLARTRAIAMDAAQAQLPAQGMMAVSGIPVNQLAAILGGCTGWVAIETGFDTAIVGGDVKSLQTISSSQELAGAKITMLPVGIASHTPLMAAAVPEFARALESSGLKDPIIPVVAGVTGQLVRESAAALTTLQRQLTEAIRWHACMDTCAESGIAVALELGPGGALARMLNERHPSIECRSLADFRSIGGALRWLSSRL